jgi:hypothetical protein
MTVSKLFDKAIELIDKANSQDPNTESISGKDLPKELVYAMRMTETLNQFEPNASEALKLAVRSQHICRWEIPRDSYEMNRVGYIQWRNDLKKFHASKALDILNSVGYDKKTIQQVEILVLKKKLKKNIETQTIEDVACLVLLEHYLEAFSDKTHEEKMVDIIKKTWNKMSDKGHVAAMNLKLSAKTSELISKAVS